MADSISLTPALVNYIHSVSRPEHPALARCRLETGEAFPDFAWYLISPEQSAFFGELVRIGNIARIIEIGVFTGYSALTFSLAARAVNPVKATVVAIDLSREWLDFAERYWDEAGVRGIVRPLHGNAADVLDMMIAGGDTGYDLVFIDANKMSTLDYYERALHLVRPTGTIVIDNVLWEGKVADPSINDPDTLALRKAALFIRDDDRVDFAFSSIGDGLIICTKR